MEKVDRQVLGTAYTRFQERYYPNNAGVGLWFWGFLGCTRVPDYSFEAQLWELPDKQARIVTMLAGPHHAIIFKVLEAQGHDPGRSLDLDA